MFETLEKTSGGSPPDVPTRGAPVSVTLWQAGRSQAVEAYEGESLMPALKRAGLPLLAVCGGKGACGTCKVGIAPEWGALLPEPEKRELRLLAHLKAKTRERLSCRIPLTAELNGLTVEACDPSTDSSTEGE